MYSYDGFDLFDHKVIEEAQRLKVEKKFTSQQLYDLFAKEFVNFFLFFTGSDSLFIFLI